MILRLLTIGLLQALLLFAVSDKAYAEVKCYGSASITYHTCSVGAFALSCSMQTYTKSYPCGWFFLAGGSGGTDRTECIAIGDTDVTCVGQVGSYSCDADNNWSGIGCEVCDTTVCKAGTTTYTQACGDTTRDYSCTNQCGSKIYWSEYDFACKECQTDTNCGINPRDCGADYCQHCERTISPWTPLCGDQTRTCTDNDGSCDGDDCAGVSLSQCQECRVISPWSNCDDNHERHRTCTDYCGGCDGVSLVENCVGTITGTLFDASDVGNTCSAAEIAASPKIENQAFSILPTPNPLKWPIISESAPTKTTDGDGLYSQQVYASWSLPANYIFDYTALLNSSRVAGIKTQCGVLMAAVTSQGQSVTKNTGFWRVYGGWWQVVGGSVYAAEGVESTIPASVLPITDQVLILPNANGRDGLLSYGTAWQGTELGTNPNVKVSDSLRRIQSLYAGLRYDYNFYKTRMDVFTKTAWDGGAVTYNDGGKGYQIFTHTGDVTLNALSLSGSQKAIFLVDGDVTISGNILSPVGTFMGIISSGKITVSSWVTDVQGWVVAETIDIPCEDANSNGVCDKTDVQFKGEGSFVAWTDMNFDRDQYKVNNTQPSEKFVYRNDFLLNVPAPMKVYTRKFTPFVP